MAATRRSEIVDTTGNPLESISRLTLGTAQLGLPYGLANRSGRPDDRMAREIVETAVAGGVNAFDTAAAYGDSEEVLGRVLAALGLAGEVVVVTKVRPLTPEELDDPAVAAAAIERSVANSRKRLRLDRLPVVLFHREADSRHLDVLARMKRSGRVGRIGVSCEGRPGGALSLLADGRVDAIQVPASVLDHLHRTRGVFAAAARSGKVVFVRSVFLQGLLVMPEESVPEPLQAVLPARRRLAALAADAGVSLAELAVRYLLGLDGVRSLLTGVETPDQIRANIEMIRRGPLPPEVMAAVEQTVPELPEEVLDPGRWWPVDAVTR